MPLPADSSLALVPHTNPGESEHTKPKQALIIRMSEEVLDALQSYGGEKPPIEFDFGNRPGIYIGQSFYPMSGSGESGHELYLRTTSSKQTHPLKHYANVTHKYAVDRRERDEAKATDRIRERVNDAAKQKEEHKTVFLDIPPPLTPSSSATATSKKKRKDPTSAMFRNALKNSDKATPLRNTITPASTSASSSFTAPPRPSSPSPAARKKEGLRDHPRRKSLIHCLALSGEKTRDHLTKLILGAGASPSAKQDFWDLLDDVAEPAGPLEKGEDPGSQNWLLKREAWSEVRPFEWPKWSESDRLSVARAGRRKLHELGVKTTESVWKHFEHRQTNNTPVISASPSNPSGEPKRGMTSMEMKEKEKRKSKPDPKAEIRMKDEGARATASASRATSSLAKPTPDEGSRRPQVPPPLRTGAGGKKLPGSGYKASNLASPGASPSPTSQTAPKAIVDPRSKPGRELQSHSLPPKPCPATVAHTSAKPDRNPVTGLPNKRIGKTKGAEADSDRDENGRGRATHEKGKSVDTRDNSSSLKRKQMAEADDDEHDGTHSRALAAKKRRMEASATPISTLPPAKDAKLKTSSLPKKVDTTPGTKLSIKKETSPLPPLPPSPKVKKERDQSPVIRTSVNRETKLGGQLLSSHQRSESAKGNGSGKSRRRSPIYTSSSEDEDEISQPVRTTTLPTPSPNGDHTSNHRHIKQEPNPLPGDRAAVRARYKEAYTEYYELYGLLRKQRLRIENQMHRGRASSDSGEDILSNDELRAKSEKFKQLSSDLSAMRAIIGGD